MEAGQVLEPREIGGSGRSMRLRSSSASRAHAYELIGRNVLPHIRLGRRIVVPKRAVEKLLDPPEQAFEA